jgi:hypothetical protein
MALADLRVVGPSASFGHYVVAGGTAIQAGEPIHSLGTPTGGENNVNTYVLMAVSGPVIGSHAFGGVALKSSENAAAGTTLTQYLNTVVPVANVGRIIGKATTSTEADTATELAGLIGDATVINYDGTGAADGGELYTILSNPTTNTHGLKIVGGNPALAELEVVADDRVFRRAVS